MKIEIIRSHEHKISHWAGGMTTQLFIYPETADYQNRDFLWRISSASVEVQESVFSNLPGISRKLMVIDGELLIEHEGEYSICIKPFEQDSFMGDWNTKSFGKATDFNLMMAKGCVGSIDAVSIEGQEVEDSIVCGIKENFNQISKIFYAVKGDFKIKIGNNDCCINVYESDIVVITNKSTETLPKIILENTGVRSGKIIRTLIYY